MWCAQCQADVATEISADGQSLLCTTCGEEVRRVFAPSLHPTTRSARELLERWAQDRELFEPDAFDDLPAEGAPSSEAGAHDGSIADSESTGAVTPDASEPTTPAVASTTPTETEAEEPSEPDSLSVELPFRSTPSSGKKISAPHWPRLDAESSDSLPEEFSSYEIPEKKVAEEPTEKTEPIPASESADSSQDVQAEETSEGVHLADTESTPKPKFRIDGAHEAPTAPRESGGARERRGRRRMVRMEEKKRRRKRRSDEPHAAMPAPHTDIEKLAAGKGAIVPGRSEALWGQLLAYSGVGVLTVGTALVLWGYFGHVERYASTGWLVTTAGQMLLLLGIVTLVAGGMQQTTHEVTERIETLGGRMVRIEASTEKLLKGPHFGKKSRSRNRARVRAQHRRRDDDEHELESA